MKIASFVLLSVIGAATASRPVRKVGTLDTHGDIRADSELGAKLLSQARRVADVQGEDDNEGNYYAVEGQDGYFADGENYDPNNQNGYNNAEAQWYATWQIAGSNWLAGYSLKFDGCYSVNKWNREADGDDARVLTSNIVRFRLCPSDYCNANGSGCRSNFGEYIMDMDVFLATYLQLQANAGNWQNMVQYDYDWAEGQGQGQGQEEGQENWNEANWQNLNAEDYMQCQETQIAQASYLESENMQANAWDGEGGNQGGDNGNYADNYYMGPFCGQQGGAINVGLFKDQDCQIPADKKGGAIVYENSGLGYLPFSESSLVQSDCFSCYEWNVNDEEMQAYFDNQAAYQQQQDEVENDYWWGDEDDAQDEDYVNHVCEVAYLMSGKCETNLPKYFFNKYKTKNIDACNYMEGIKVIREDGSIVTSKKNAPGHLGHPVVGPILIVLFGGLFAGLTYYVVYLKNRFERASIEIE